VQDLLVGRISEGNHPDSPIEPPEGSEELTRKGRKREIASTSFHGPLARVAINTAGPALVLYFLLTASAFTVAGMLWWAAAALALGPTLIVAGMAVIGFCTVARRCSRCGDWAELVETVPVRSFAPAVGR
jgi:hypothetical protein